MCLSTTKLQLSLLNLSLDQLVKGSDVGGLLNLLSSLVVLNPYSEIRRISFVVGVVFAHGKRQSGPPQIRDGFIDPCLPPFVFVLWLHLLLGALEGDT